VRQYCFQRMNLCGGRVLRSRGRAAELQVSDRSEIAKKPPENLPFPVKTGTRSDAEKQRCCTWTTDATMWPTARD
jgi:hypothetical protein